MTCYGAANLREKAGRVIWGGLIGLALVAGPAVAEERPFQAIFGEGYDFLHKQSGASVATVPDRTVVQEQRPFRTTLYGGGYAVVQRAGQTVGKTEAVVTGQTTAEKSPFEELFKEGYDFVAPHG